MGNPHEISRRSLLLGFAGALAVLSTSCDGTNALLVSPTKTPEKEKVIPQDRDVVLINDVPYLLTNEKRYQIFGNLEEYVKKSKLREYGRRIIAQRLENLEEIPVGELSSERYVIDHVSGEKKKNKRNGGEAIDYHGGLFTSGKDMEERDPKNDMFNELEIELKENDFETFDNFKNMYGARYPEIYDPFSTFQRTIPENVAKTIDFIKTESELQPLVQRNGIGHSQGGLMLLEGAMKYPNVFNNIFLLSTPIFGIEESTGLLIKLLKKIAEDKFNLPFFKEEKILDEYITLGKDTKRKKEVEEFARKFTSTGRKIICFVSEGDLIVSEKTGFINTPGVKNITIPGERLDILRLIFTIQQGIDPVTLIDLVKKGLDAHGSPLWTQRVKEEIRDAIGMNLAA